MIQEKPSMIQPALVGGVLLGITSAFPVIEWLNCACCLLVIGGGLLASYLYLRDYPTNVDPMTYGDGGLLGLLTGLIGGLVWAAVEIPLTYFKNYLGMDLQDLARLETLLGDTKVPPFLEDFVAGGALGLGVLLVSLFLQLIIAIVFASVGGIIGVALFGSKTPADPQPPVSPGPPPPFQGNRGNPGP
jgi:hypothetical protein